MSDSCGCPWPGGAAQARTSELKQTGTSTCRSQSWTKTPGVCRASAATWFLSPLRAGLGSPAPSANLGSAGKGRSTVRLPLWTPSASPSAPSSLALMKLPGHVPGPRDTLEPPGNVAELPLPEPHTQRFWLNEWGVTCSSLASAAGPEAQEVRVCGCPSSWDLGGATRSTGKPWSFCSKSWPLQVPGGPVA